MAYGNPNISNYSPTCLTSSRFSMSATIIHKEVWEGDGPTPPLDEYGTWVKSQDPLTGAIVRVWEPADNQTTPNVDEDDINVQHINCLARGIVDGGIRVAGTTERFAEFYENVDYIKMWVPMSVRVTKRDRITNIRDARGIVRWLDEEYYNSTETPKATVFNVNGVTPLFDAFNNMVEQFVLLERAEVS